MIINHQKYTHIHSTIIHAHTLSIHSDTIHTYTNIISRNYTLRKGLHTSSTLLHIAALFTLSFTASLSLNINRP